jgi:hypothetical protein
MSAEQQFEKSFPFPLRPTNIPNVFSIPPLPDDFDPNTASAAECLRHGLPWPRPGADAPAPAIAAWKRVFSRNWRREDWVEPVSHPVPGRTHRLKTPPRPQDNGTYNSPFWAGCSIDTPQSLGWNGILGFWSVPTVSKPSEKQGANGGWDSSSWVGLDGDFLSQSSDVIQAGVEQKVAAGGTATYTAWYEWIVPVPANLPQGTLVDANGYPLAWTNPTNGTYQYIHQANIPGFKVKPGQTVMTAILLIPGRGASVTFANETTGGYFSIFLKPPPNASFNGTSAEWIMEAPDGGWPNTALPKFTPIVFEEAFATLPNCPQAGLPGNGNILNLFQNGSPVTSTTTNGTSVTIKFTG